MKWIKIHECDNVAVALEDLFLTEKIPQGHKFAVKDIDRGQQIIKYGAPIGVAVERINKGCWVHTHNVKTLLNGEVKYSYDGAPTAAGCHGQEHSFFQGYLRDDGRCAVRNEIWIIATVGCVNSVAERIAGETQAYGAGKVDGIHAITHPYGCSQMGEDQENTLKALAALSDHPNAGGVLLLGLGCENCNFEALSSYLPAGQSSERMRWMRCQDAENEIKEGLSLTRQLVDYAATFRREPIEVSKLIVGLKCGGSDGLSGITANPLVGMFSDLHCSEGGSVILTEVPEMFGAEKLLMQRCKDRRTFKKTVQLINSYKNYFRSHNQVIYENPSPGNKAGGITTLEDKSLGCVQKGGCSIVNDVLAYGDALKEPGLNLLSAPGNDLVAATALALSGAHIILFTTGRGTPFGGPVPTIKISSNHRLYEKKKNWIDYDAEAILEAPDKGKAVEEFYDFVIDVASGSKTKSEMQGYRDIAIFKQGVTL